MQNSRVAQLILENGDRFTGKAFGHIHDVVGEVVFTTNMTGYQETLTDPSFCGQIVVMTYPSDWELRNKFSRIWNRTSLRFQRL